jgi:drug/metabolite transporter (DMT)-like permease
MSVSHLTKSVRKVALDSLIQAANFSFVSLTLVVSTAKGIHQGEALQGQTTYLPAILWVLLSTALWTLIFAAAKFADGSVGAFQITLLRYVGAFAVLLVLTRYQGGLAAQKSKQPWTHFLRALCGSSAAVTITWASVHMPIADATAIGMLYGVLAVLLGVIVLKEHVSRQHWLAVVISVAGASVVMSSQGAFHARLPVGARGGPCGRGARAPWSTGSR